MENYKLLDSKIKKYNNIIIAKHISPDWDAQGSASGLKEIIIDNYKNKNVIIVGEGIDNIENDEIGNIELIKDSLLITVDTANIERVDFDNKEDVKEIFKIDHHLEVDTYSGDNKLIDVSSIACTQIIAQWAIFMKLKISKEAAYFLYKGLITDSGRFLFDKTNEQTFNVASQLVKSGAEITKIYDELYLQDLSLVSFKWKKFLKAKYYSNNQIAYIILKKRDIPSSLTEEKAKYCLNTMSSIKDVKIWCLIFQDSKNNVYKVSIRSRNYDVNSVAVQFNGGGHKLASGCRISKLKDFKNVLAELDKLLKQEAN